MKKLQNRFRAIFIGGILLAAGLATNVAPAHADTTIFVDDNGVECPTAEFTSIQAAVDSLGSAPSGTITVCTGTYAESVIIRHANGLTLQSQRVGMATIVPPSANFESALIAPILSSDVTIQGFTFDGLGELRTDGVAAGAILFNESSGTIEDNVITNWHAPGYAGHPNFLASMTILDNQGESVTINGNRITNYQREGIEVSGASAMTISNNLIMAPSGIFSDTKAIFIRPNTGQPTGRITNNTIVGEWVPGTVVDSSGIVLEEVNGLTVDTNLLNHMSYGIEIINTCTFAIQAGNTVAHADNHTITGNTVIDADYGIFVGAAAHNGCSTYASNNSVLNNTITNPASQGTTGIAFQIRGFLTNPNDRSANAFGLNELATGNNITNFKTGVQTQALRATLTGVFTPNVFNPMP